MGHVPHIRRRPNFHSPTVGPNCGGPFAPHKGSPENGHQKLQDRNLIHFEQLSYIRARKFSEAIKIGGSANERLAVCSCSSLPWNVFDDDGFGERSILCDLKHEKSTYTRIRRPPRNFSGSNSTGSPRKPVNLSKVTWATCLTLEGDPISILRPSAPNCGGPFAPHGGSGKSSKIVRMELGRMLTVGDGRCHVKKTPKDTASNWAIGLVI
ncbi:hypothetical protein STAS_18625 [Striga asiatica]|uniref:Uncharacterized protein n=1 Tax=Striga asiatica TaxID=4170 RepID=A0A5A7QD38_STRAF|nr:hypothetical protein STAS_18625 [Striga asiatica]